ncbi:hypothetical protein TNCV_2306541 [Trichonephila clavipes]|nr:hypothetical protein TNCV_2306541 [Trichonephila clavipes]
MSVVLKQSQQTISSFLHQTTPMRQSLTEGIPFPSAQNNLSIPAFKTQGTFPFLDHSLRGQKPSPPKHSNPSEAALIHSNIP